MASHCSLSLSNHRDGLSCGFHRMSIKYVLLLIGVPVLPSLFPKSTVLSAALMCPLAFFAIPSCALPIIPYSLHSSQRQSACNACTLPQSTQRKWKVHASKVYHLDLNTWRGHWLMSSCIMATRQWSWLWDCPRPHAKHSDLYWVWHFLQSSVKYTPSKDSILVYQSSCHGNFTNIISRV